MIRHIVGSSLCIARLALRGSDAPEEPPLAPLQLELAAALSKAYAQPLPSPATQLSTTQ